MVEMSDVAERLPVFEAAREVVGKALARGAFAGLPFDAQQYLDGMRPIGMFDGVLVLPKSSDPTVIPVIPLKQREMGHEIGLPPMTPRELVLAHYIAEQAGTKLVDDPKAQGMASASVRNSLVGVLSRRLELAPDDDHIRRRPIEVPSALAVSRLSGKLDRDTADMGYGIARWNFALRQQGAVHAGDFPYPTPTWITALAEKRSFAAAYQIFMNLGRNAVAGSMHAVVAPYRNMFPFRADLMRNDLLERDADANPHNPSAHAGLALTVMAIAQLFGDAEEPLTIRELQSLADIGVVPWDESS